MRNEKKNKNLHFVSYVMDLSNCMAPFDFLKSFSNEFKSFNNFLNNYNNNNNNPF